MLLNKIFEWDPKKNVENKKKHGVFFEEAVKVFLDTKALINFDDKHSKIDEDRYIVIGKIQTKNKTMKIIFVVYTESNNTIRLISARSANVEEEVKYFNENYDT